MLPRDKYIIIWDLNTSKRLATLYGHLDEVVCLKILSGSGN